MTRFLYKTIRLPPDGFKGYEESKERINHDAPLTNPLPTGGHTSSQLWKCMDVTDEDTALRGK